MHCGYSIWTVGHLQLSSMHWLFMNIFCWLPAVTETLQSEHFPRFIQRSKTIPDFLHFFNNTSEKKKQLGAKIFFSVTVVWRCGVCGGHVLQGPGKSFRFAAKGMATWVLLKSLRRIHINPLHLCGFRSFIRNFWWKNLGFPGKFWDTEEQLNFREFPWWSLKCSEKPPWFTVYLYFISIFYMVLCLPFWGVGKLQPQTNLRNIWRDEMPTKSWKILSYNPPRHLNPIWWPSKLPVHSNTLQCGFLGTCPPTRSGLAFCLLHLHYFGQCLPSCVNLYVYCIYM